MTSAQSLYGTFIFYLTNLGTIQTLNYGPVNALAYTHLEAFLVVTGAGVIGVLPFWSAVVGLCGVGSVTLVTWFVFRYYSLVSVSFGIGFWVLWLAFAVNLVVAVWMRRSAVGAKEVESGYLGDATPAEKAVSGLPRRL